MERVGQRGLHVTFLLIALVGLAAIPQAVLARGHDGAALVALELAAHVATFSASGVPPAKCLTIRAYACALTL